MTRFTSLARIVAKSIILSALLSILHPKNRKQYTGVIVSYFEYLAYIYADAKGNIRNVENVNSSKSFDDDLILLLF